MDCKTCNERNIGYQIASVATTETVATIPDPVNKYKEVTVFNKTDKDIIVNYKNDEAKSGNFIVPAGEKFTKVLKVGTFVADTIKLLAVGSATTSGKVTLNFTT